MRKQVPIVLTPRGGTGMLKQRLLAYCASSTVLLLSACNADTSLPASPPRVPPLEAVGLANLSADEGIRDPGPFPITPAVWYSRCPDTQTLQTAQWLSLSNPKVVSIDNPGGASKPRVVFEIPLSDMKFYTYVAYGTLSSQANYRVGREIISNDQHWAIPYEGNITMKCTNGIYVPSPFNNILEYTGSLQVIAVWDVRRTNLEEDAEAPSQPACDDPLTELVEQEPNCAPPPPPGASGAGDTHVMAVQAYAPPSGGGSGPRLMCDVTDWYEWRNNRWEWVERQIHWNTCSWEQ